MSEWKARRFWKAASVRPVGQGFEVALDDRPLRTPGKLPLLLPVEALADSDAPSPEEIVLSALIAHTAWHWLAERWAQLDCQRELAAGQRCDAVFSAQLRSRSRLNTAAAPGLDMRVTYGVALSSTRPGSFRRRR